MRLLDLQVFNKVGLFVWFQASLRKAQDSAAALRAEATRKQAIHASKQK